MTVEKRQVQLAKNSADMERWLRKLIRAANEVDRLRVQRKRLLKPRPLPKEASEAPSDPIPTFDLPPPKEAAKMIEAAIADVQKDDGLDIPAELDRSRKLQAMPDPKTKDKKRERRAIEKEVRQAELTGKRRRMPLTGKDALAAIRKSE
jgi:hypothetical protein